MHIVTKQELIKNVAASWRAQYPSNNGRLDFDPVEIWEQLKGLPANATEADVANIIGNYSWTQLECDECKRPVEAVVIIGEEPDYESSTASICLECLKAAIALIKDDKG